MAPLAPPTRLVRPLPTLLLGIVALVAIVGFLVGVQTDDLALRLSTKPVPVIAAIVFVVVHARDTYGWLVAAGLALSVVGDVLLEVPADLFVAGLLAFLVAHVLYIAAAVQDRRTLAPLRAIPFMLWCGGVYLWLMDGMGPLALPVAVYVTVIGGMLWRMAARADARWHTWVALAGAVAFALSDSLIAVRKFGDPFPGIREAIILLYWAGQAGLAASVLRRPAG